MSQRRLGVSEWCNHVRVRCISLEAMVVFRLLGNWLVHRHRNAVVWLVVDNVGGCRPKIVNCETHNSAVNFSGCAGRIKDDLVC